MLKYQRVIWGYLKIGYPKKSIGSTSFSNMLYFGVHSHFQTLASKQKMSQVTTPTILSATLTSGRVEEKCRRYHFWHSGRYAAFEALFDPTLLREH